MIIRIECSFIFVKWINELRSVPFAKRELISDFKLLPCQPPNRFKFEIEFVLSKFPHKNKLKSWKIYSRFYSTFFLVGEFIECPNRGRKSLSVGCRDAGWELLRWNRLIEVLSNHTKWSQIIQEEKLSRFLRRKTEKDFSTRQISFPSLLLAYVFMTLKVMPDVNLLRYLFLFRIRIIFIVRRSKYLRAERETKKKRNTFRLSFIFNNVCFIPWSQEEKISCCRRQFLNFFSFFPFPMRKNVKIINYVIELVDSWDFFSFYHRKI